MEGNGQIKVRKKKAIIEENGPGKEIKNRSCVEIRTERKKHVGEKRHIYGRRKNREGRGKKEP